MTPSQLATLKTEIQTDPISIGYAACFPDSPGHAANLINTNNQSMLQQISSSTAMTWAASGPYSNIVDASNNTSHPCRASCLVIREAFSAGLDIHIENKSLLDMLSAWVLTSVITQAEHDALISLSTTPASRAAVLGLGYVLESDIHTALMA